MTAEAWGIVLGVSISALAFGIGAVIGLRRRRQATKKRVVIRNCTIDSIVVNGQTVKQGDGEMPPEFYAAMDQLDQAFGKKKKDPEFVAVTCPHCSASCRIPATGGQCDYCGSFLNAK